MSLKILSLQADNVKEASFIFTSLSYSLLTDFSFIALYCIKSAIVPIFKECFSANLNKSSLLAIVPSSFIISHITPEG